MQRWWFSDDDKAKDVNIKTVTSVENSAERRHTFRVLVNQSLQPCELIAVSGECSKLGNWLLEHSVKLVRDKGMLCFIALSTSILIGKNVYLRSYVNDVHFIQALVIQLHSHCYFKL